MERDQVVLDGADLGEIDVVLLPEEAGLPARGLAPFATRRHGLGSSPDDMVALCRWEAPSCRSRSRVPVWTLTVLVSPLSGSLLPVDRIPESRRIPGAEDVSWWD